MQAVAQQWECPAHLQVNTPPAEALNGRQAQPRSCTRALLLLLLLLLLLGGTPKTDADHLESD